MIPMRHFALAFLFALPFTSVARSASLQVSPVSLEITPPAATAVVTLQNTSDKLLVAQARVFRWRQIDGKDTLEPTDAVVASPPEIELGGNQIYSVRIVRTEQSAVSEPEYYRLLVDELPTSATPRSGTVNVVLRYSIPVFFTGPTGGEPSLSWSVHKSNGRLALILRNEGDRHIRISALKLKDKSGRSVSFGGGLVGYALARSTVEWVSPPVRAFGGGDAEVSAQSDIGAINASVPVH